MLRFYNISQLKNHRQHTWYEVKQIECAIFIGEYE